MALSTVRRRQAMAEGEAMIPMDDPTTCPRCGLRIYQGTCVDHNEYPLQSVITWVPVSERLPEDGTNRLICFESELGSRFVTEAFWDEHSEQWVYVGNNMPVNKSLTVTHWAELPTPPVGEEGK